MKNKLTLKSLAEYWKYDVTNGDPILPNTPERMVVSTEQCQELGEDILRLIERIERIEKIINQN